MKLRAVFIGAALCIGLGLALPYTEFYLQGTRLGLSSATPAAFFVLFLILLGPQLLLRWLKPEWVFSRGELLIIFTMMSVGIVVCTRGFIGPFFGMATGPAYYAQGGADWAQGANDVLSSPYAVTDPDAVNLMYEGLPEGRRIPWQAWAGPLAWWSGLVLSMVVLVLSTVAMFRKQWIEHERLPFPVARVALALTEAPSEGKILNPLLRSRIFWIGFFIPVVLESFNGLHSYHEFIPAVSLSMPVAFGSALISDQVIRISFLMVGFAFFIDSRVAFSLWVFYLLSLPLEYIYNLAFFDHVEILGDWTAGGAHGTIMAHQQMGAMLVLVGSMAWAARKSLLDNRVAVVMFIVSFVWMSFMIRQTGVPLLVAPLVVAVALVIWLSLTRMMAQGGLATIVPAIVPSGFILSAVGVPTLGVAGTVALGLTTVWAGDLLTFLMGPVANSAFLAHEAAPKRSRISLPLAVAVMLCLAASMAMTMYLTHSVGALNLHQQYFVNFPEQAWRPIELKLSTWPGPSGTGYMWTGVGAVVMVLLTLAHRTFVWWPLHPLGFLAQGGWIMKQLWFSIFMAWIIKVAILRLGGGRTYKKATRFFIGTIVGLLVVGGIWLVIDSLTGHMNNVIRMY